MKTLTFSVEINLLHPVVQCCHPPPPACPRKKYFKLMSKPQQVIQPWTRSSYPVSVNIHIRVLIKHGYIQIVIFFSSGQRQTDIDMLGYQVFIRSSRRLGKWLVTMVFLKHHHGKQSQCRWNLEV